MTKKINDDFKLFMTSESSSNEVNDTVLNFVHRDLNPSHSTIILKLISIQTFIGLVTLLFCPQFNFSLTNNYDLFHFFHRHFGHIICTAICSAIFIGSGTIFASALLTISELKEITKTKGLYGLGLSGYFVSLFLILGSDVYLVSSLVWTLSAVLTFSTISYSALKIRYSILVS